MTAADFLNSKNIYVESYVGDQSTPENYYKLVDLLEEYRSVKTLEITNEIKIKALKWFKKIGLEESAALGLKHYNKISGFTADEVVIIWRRTTGGEWANL